MACASSTSLSGGEPDARRSRLIAPVRGTYAIYRDDEHVGTERFTITSSAGLWRASGIVELDDPVEITHGYEIIVEPSTEEPLGFDVWVELAGERQRAIGVVEGRQVSIELENIMGKEKGRVPYARGTMIDFASPIANAVLLSLLLPELDVGQSARVRTITVSLPLLEPSVVLQRYTLVARDGEICRVSVDREDGRARPIALWVRPDGLPVRVRTWPDRGESPYEMWIHLE